MKKHVTASLLTFAMFASPASAQLEGFENGPVFEGFGPTAKVEANVQIPKDTTFKIAFDGFVAVAFLGIRKLLLSSGSGLATV